MAISIVQTLAGVAIAGNQVRTVTFNSVAAGNSLLIAYIADGAVPSGCTWSATSYITTNAVQVLVQGSRKNFGVLYRHAVSSGTHAVSVSSTDGTFSCFGWYVGIEVSGLANQSASIITPTSTSSGFGNTATLTSSTLPVTNQLLVENFITGEAVSPMSFSTPTNYTSQFARQTSGETMGSVCTRIVSATTAQSISHGTMAGSENWGIALFSFEEAVAVGQPTGKRMGGVPFSAGDSSLFGVRRW